MQISTTPGTCGVKSRVCGTTSSASAPSQPVIAWARGSAYASASLISPASTIRAAQESSWVSRKGSAAARSSGIQYARVSPTHPMVTRPPAAIALT